ncbi:EF-hand domain-containing protein [Pseudomonas sp. Irchel 3A18]|uniref:EF-hand domain-containing protein n=1 Tax=Pseudomonas sp. Irchel 3A18 TaxID=2008905 RepID=UPI000BA433DC|nr:EF-hand domain-containing protein [Pseudomonas sp. Irchel 3A18]
MISGISSSYSSYTSSTSLTSGTNSKKFQEELLAKLDTDGDGSINKEELSSALSSDKKDGITVSLSEAFSSLDSNDDDSLDADELAALTPPPPPPATDLAEDLLSSLDTDGDGSINSDELTTGLTNTGSTADSTKVFDALDTNEDGTVSLEELTASLQPQQPPAGPPPAQNANVSSTDSAALFSALDTDSDDSISATELATALSQSNSNSEQTNANQMAAQALSKMIAALGERYDTEGSKPIGKYLDTAA